MKLWLLRERMRAITKLYERVGPRDRGHFLAMLFVKLCLQIFQITEGKLFRKRGLTENQVANAFLYDIALRRDTFY